MSAADEEPLPRLPAIERLLEGSTAPLPERARSAARQVARSMRALVVPTPQGKSVPRPALPPGQRVAGRYEVLAELGRGGAATVYRARDLKFGVDVALKVASGSGEDFGDFQARFAREARISFLIGQEPGLVRALDWGELEPGRTLYLAMDLVEGAGPLDLRGGSLPERLRRLSAASGLVERVHRRGIVHRDLKPGNFLVSRPGSIHLGDFGTARPLGEGGPASLEDALRTQAGTLIGTPLFMAPEQFAQPSQVDLRADVYALGVMLFLCLSGGYPYEGQSALQVISRQMQARWGGAPRPALPAAAVAEAGQALAELCHQAIDQDPAARPASAGAFRAALEAIAAGRQSPTSSRRLPAQRPSGPPAGARERLGLDPDGFVTWEALRALRSGMGPRGFEALLGGTPALVAVRERPRLGQKLYEGRVALLLPRAGGGTEVTLGRTNASDVTVNLVTVSKQHLRFLRDGAGAWRVVEAGSVNGASLRGEPLHPGQELALGDGDLVCLAEHLTCRFLLPGALSLALEHGAWEALA